MNRVIAASFCLFFVVIGSTASGQFVRFGPYGGVRIRAPFFAMDIPGPPVPPPFAFVPRRPVVVAAPYPVYPVYAYPSVQYGVPIAVEPPVVVQRPTLQGQSYAAGRPVTPPADLAALESQLWEAASRLMRSLAVQRDVEVWSNYLAPDRIVAAIEQGNPASLAQLTDHYDGVVANQQLAWLTRLDGFAATRSLLHQYLGSQQMPMRGPINATQPPAESAQPRAESAQPRADKPLTDSADPAPLPTPLPDPVPADGAAVPAPATPATPVKPAQGPSILGE